VLHLEPGIYSWTALPEDGYGMVGQSQGTFTVTGCGPVCSASLGDTVWLDNAPRDGLQSAGEQVIPGVRIELLDAEDDVLAVTSTDENGHYLFADLCPGTYRIRFELPDLPGLENESWTIWQNGDVAVDSNADDEGLTGLIELAEGVEDLSWDAGILAEQVSSTTVTTLPPTTTIPETSTTTVAATTSTTTDVLTETTTTLPATTSTTVPPVTATTLPFTGFEAKATALIGLIALGGGTILLGIARRHDEESVSENIGTW
jgi:hypothetical protein